MKEILFVNLYDFVTLKPFDVPIGIKSLEAIVNKSKKYTAKICDFNNYYYKHILLKKGFKEAIEDMATVILNFNVPIISIYTMCNNYYLAIFLSNYIKKISNIKIILGGPHATLVAEKTLESFKSVDYIGLGEGESNIINILDSIFNNDFENVNGLAYRNKAGEIVTKWNKKNDVNLDTLDTVVPINIEESNKNYIDIEVGRGCPFKCTFCSTQKFWGNKFRIKSLNKLFDELKFYVEEKKINTFSFQHDLFTFDKQYIRQFCHGIDSRKLDIKWGCSSRIDSLEAENIELMAKMGCFKIFFGIETGSKKIQKEIGKILDTESIVEKAKILKKYKISSTFSFIYGFPNETVNDLNQTLKLMYDLKKLDILYKETKTQIQLWPLTFLPGTYMGDRYKDELIFKSNKKLDFNYCAYIDEPEVQSLIKENKDIFLNYYNYPKAFKNDFCYLNITFMNIFNKSYSYIHCSFDEMLRLIKYDFVKFYREFFLINKENMYKLDINYIISNNLLIYDEILCFVELFFNYITHSKDFKDNNYLKDIIKFEYNIVKCLFSTVNYCKIEDFEYDVYNILSGDNKLSNKKHTRIKFSKKNKNAVVTKMN